MHWDIKEHLKVRSIPHNLSNMVEAVLHGHVQYGCRWNWVTGFNWWCDWKWVAGLILRCIVLYVQIQPNTAKLTGWCLKVQIIKQSIKTHCESNSRSYQKKKKFQNFKPTLVYRWKIAKIVSLRKYLWTYLNIYHQHAMIFMAVHNYTILEDFFPISHPHIIYKY